MNIFKKILVSFFIFFIFTSTTFQTGNAEVILDIKIPIIETYNDGEPWDIVDHYTWLPHFFKTVYFNDYGTTFENILKDPITLATGYYQVSDSISDRWFRDIDYGCGFLYQINTANITIYETTKTIPLMATPLSNFIMIHDMVVHEEDTVHLFNDAILTGSVVRNITHWLKYSNGVSCNYIYIPEFRNRESSWILTLITFDGRSMEIDLSNKYGELFQILITESRFDLI